MKNTMAKYLCLLPALLVAGCASGVPPANPYPFSESLMKGVRLSVPQEFREGSATLHQAYQWAFSNIHHIAVPVYRDIDLDGEDEILFEVVEMTGNSGAKSYMTFSRESCGYRFMGVFSNHDWTYVERY